MSRQDATGREPAEQGPGKQEEDNDDGLGLTPEGPEERNRLRERLHELELNLSQIDDRYGGSFREQIDAVRRKLDEAERELQASGGEAGHQRIWSSLSTEIRDIEARMTRQG